MVRRNRVNNVYRDTYQGRSFTRPEGTVLPRTRQQMRGDRSVNPRTSRFGQPMTPARRQQLEENRQRTPSTTRPVRPTEPANRQPAQRSRQDNPETARPARSNTPTNPRQNEGARTAPSRRPMEKTAPARTNNPPRGKDKN